MRWLMIAFLVSLVALLIASAGVAHHVWREHSRRRRGPGPVEKQNNPHSSATSSPVINPDTEEAP